VSLKSLGPLAYAGSTPAPGTLTKDDIDSSEKVIVPRAATDPPPTDLVLDALEQALNPRPVADRIVPQAVSPH
jgi:hypothetical protein